MKEEDYVSIEDLSNEGEIQELDIFIYHSDLMFDFLEK